MFLVCHLILQDFVIKGPRDLWVGAPHGKLSTSLVRLS